MNESAVFESSLNGLLIRVRVIPRSATAGVAGTRGGALLVRLNAPPVEGAANTELIEVIAGYSRCPDAGHR